MRCSPGEKSVYLVYIIDNLMARCVARNPKEIVRQVAPAKELDSAKSVKFSNQSHLGFPIDGGG